MFQYHNLFEMIYRVPKIPLLIPEKVNAIRFKLDHRITVVLNEFGTGKLLNQKFISFRVFKIKITLVM